MPRISPKFAFHRPESPTCVKMRYTFLISQNNKSFDMYAQEMKRRNAPLAPKSPSKLLSDQSPGRITSPFRVNDSARSPGLWQLGSRRNLLQQMEVGMRSKIFEALSSGSKRHLLDSRRPLQAKFSASGNNQSNESPEPIKPRFRNPTARDGHAAIVYFGCLWIFGGDRHHMPFNDLQILPLAPFLKKDG